MLPEYCDPGLLAARGERLRGVVPADLLPRFQGAIEHAGAPVRVSLDFRRERRALAGVDGRLQAPVRLTCQRCLKPLELLLETRIDVILIRAQDEDAATEQGREVIPVPTERLDLHAMIEDELILSLPMHALHPEGSCVAPATPAPGVFAARRRNPFAALSDTIGTTRK